MKWFEGSINEAVATSKSRKAIFVVFIEGKDDTSVQFAEAINATDVSCRLEQDDFVAIRLESGSDTYRFFAQIYQLVPVPSLFFIGENGTPLEIIAGSTTATDLATKIDLVLTKVGKNKNASVNLIDAEQKATAAAAATNANAKVDVDQKNENTTGAGSIEVSVTQTVSDNVNNDVIKSSIKEEPSTSLKTNEAPKTVNETIETATKELTVEEKVEKARQLIEVQKKQRVEEEERKEREREIERRKVGQDVQKLRQKQQDLEMKQAYEERMREKAADTAAREKVLQQIAQDKLERKQKELAAKGIMQQQQQLQQQSEPTNSEPSEPPISTTTISRIQFRLPSGNPYVAQFEPTNTLRDLRTFVVEYIDLPFRQFAMSTSFPRRELMHEDDDKTLLELELVPTAVILILPLKNPNVTATVKSSEDVGIIPRFMWSTFALFSAVYYYLIGYFTGGGRAKPKQPSTSAENKDTENNGGGAVASNVQNVASSSGLVRRYLGNRGNTTIKTEGNIHRLHSGGDDNDENNTWNGNSTQQM
ncbi:UBX domain-containing protein 4 isoform X1 [Xylocopa sonorina]|uniref:UBX domain-containing protein 4 isoform X1 n=1 Tax=Xylocopa sonorina TaxID=1818115 RepID=UPI00403B1170